MIEIQTEHKLNLQQGSIKAYVPRGISEDIGRRVFQNHDERGFKVVYSPTPDFKVGAVFTQTDMYQGIETWDVGMVFESVQSGKRYYVVNDARYYRGAPVKRISTIPR